MTLADELAATRADLRSSIAARCGVARFVREIGIDGAEFDEQYGHYTINELHAYLVRRGFPLGAEQVKRHSPLRVTDRCSCRSPRI